MNRHCSFFTVLVCARSDTPVSLFTLHDRVTHRQKELFRFSTHGPRRGRFYSSLACSYINTQIEEGYTVLSCFTSLNSQLVQMSLISFSKLRIVNLMSICSAINKVCRTTGQDKVFIGKYINRTCEIIPVNIIKPPACRNRSKCRTLQSNLGR